MSSSSQGSGPTALPGDHQIKPGMCQSRDEQQAHRHANGDRRQNQLQNGPVDQFDAQIQLPQLIDQAVTVRAFGGDMLSLQQPRSVNNPRQTPGQNIHEIANGNQNEDGRQRKLDRLGD